MKKVAFYTLGCKLNFSETSTISRMFDIRGYEKVDFANTPDVFVINTCSVTENADRKCRKIVRDARKFSPSGFIAVIGCYAQLKPTEIAAIPGVDAVLGASEKFRLFELLDGFERKSKTEVFTSEISQSTQFHPSHSIHDRTRTFLKIQDGCNYGCSFCTIPLARGKSRSASIAEVVGLAKEIAASGIREIVLTGVNTGDFGIRNGKRRERFIDLIKELDKVDEIARIRISSIEPNLLTHEIIDFVAKSRKFVPHFHIPLQSGSDKILKGMNRRYLSNLYGDRVTHIKSILNHACIGADVIVGFPGETNDDFLETYRFLNELDISYLHVFTYSERPDTSAAIMDTSVPLEERNLRSRMLRNLSLKKRRYFYNENLGRTESVLFENDVNDGFIHGFTGNYIRVATEHDPALINTIKEVQLVKINNNGFVEVEQSTELVTH